MFEEIAKMLLYKTQKPRGCLSFRLLYGILISALSRNVKRLAPCFSGDFFFPRIRMERGDENGHIFGSDSNRYSGCSHYCPVYAGK